MTYLFFAFCIIIAIIIVISSFQLINERFDAKKLLIELLVSSSLVVLVYGIAVFSISETVSYIAYSIYGSFITWLSLNLLLFFVDYSKDFKWINKIKKLLAFITCIDSIYMYSNNFTHKLFTLKTVTLWGPTSYILEKLPLYNIHLVYLITINVVLFILMLIKILKTKGIYRTGYMFLLFCYVLIFGSSLLCLVLDVYYDYSIFLYGLFGIFVTSIVIKYVPNIINKNIMNLILSNVTDSIFGFDYNGTLIYMNEPGKQLMSYYNIKNIDNYYKSVYLNKNLDTVDELSWDDTYKRYGKTRHYTTTYSKMYNKNEVYIGEYLIVHDNTLEYEKNEREKIAISYDQLTGIYNKSIFDLKVNKLMNEVNEDYYMICVNIKNFKLVNEFYGSSVGDQLLVSLANVLKNTFKGNNLVVYSRIQADKFAIFMPKYTYDKMNLYNKLSTINKMVDSLNIYLYMGICPVNTSISNEVNVLIEHANLAASLVKHNNSNCIKIYDDSIKDSILEENKTISAFEQAIKNNEFVLYIQPQISKDEKVLGGEALVRWIKDGKVVSPNDFIPLFEKHGLISRLDKYIWELACKQLSVWKKEGIDYYLSINFSALDFFGMDIYKVLTNLIKKYDIDPKKLKLEITESVFVSKVDELANIINKFRKAGFCVEMDDFGSGYSSLNMLKSIDIDTIKMDMGFLYDEDKSNKSRLILEALIKLSKELNLEVITEGVETREQVDFLKKCGCDVFQGYYFGKPMSIDSFKKLYLEDNNE